MTTRKVAARRVESELVNAGFPPYNNQDPPLEQVPLGHQAPMNPPIMKHGQMKVAFLNMTKFIDSQSHVVTTQAQGMTTQANREVAPHMNKNTSTMASR